MAIKIFLPGSVFPLKENHKIYGKMKVDDVHAASYYITTAEAMQSSRKAVTDCSSNLELLGFIVNDADELANFDTKADLIFVYNAYSAHIQLKHVNIKNNTSINVFLYDEEQFVKLQESEDLLSNTTRVMNFNDDIRYLLELLKQKRRFLKDDNCNVRSNRKSIFHVMNRLFNLPFELLNIVFLFGVRTQPLRFILKKTVLYEHFQEWLQFKKIGKRRFNIIIDKFLGCCLMFVLLFYLSNSGYYLIEGSHYVIFKLRKLLQSLKGSPIGIKLNVQLNSFLLDCFGYHVDLWANFLDLIEPLVRKLFIPVAVFGIMGFSYQLALLSDLVSVIGLHAHCFSIYSAVLYKVELNGLQVLWKMVLGKRKNLLKNRVESHNYKNRQLYLATLFFTTLLFLFPTILTYYVVFTTLRLCIFVLNIMLLIIRRHLLEFPFEILIRWCTGNFSDIEAVQLKNFYGNPVDALMEHRTKSTVTMDPKMFVFILEILPSPLSRVLCCQSGVLQELNAKDENYIKDICQRILYGTF